MEKVKASELYTRFSYRKAVSIAFDKVENADLEDHLQANANRFAAHKAVYAQNKINSILSNPQLDENSRQIWAKSALQTFDRWQKTEARLATNNAIAALKWDNLAADASRYYLQYRTANDEKVRDQHRILNRTTLPANDDFWRSYYPPNDWNCRCNVVKVLRSQYQASDSSKANRAGNIATKKRPNFRFNPGIQKAVFPENTSYLKHLQDQPISKVILAAKDGIRKQYADYKEIVKTSKGEILVDNISIIETSKGSANDKTYFLKQEIVRNIGKYTPKMKYLRREKIDLSHNKTDSIFYKRKVNFRNMHVYKLKVENIEYIVKLGVFTRDFCRNGTLKHLYIING